MKINIYGDESCHLQNDGVDLMVIGAVWCPKDKIKEINEQVKSIKIKHSVSKNQELKWTKVSKSNIELYSEIIEYFFSSKALKFRATCLEKSRYKGLGSEFFKSFYFGSYGPLLLDILIDSKGDSYNIFWDKRDASSADRNKEIQTILRFFGETKIHKVQSIDSMESQILQIADILIGAIGYKQRGLVTSQGKLTLIKLIEKKRELATGLKYIDSLESRGVK